MLALLARRFGDLDLADESVQDALVTALHRWGESGVPANPAAWLYTVARNTAIDRLRRASADARRLASVAHDLVQVEHVPGGGEEPDMIVEQSDVGDDSLRLLLLCCHPALEQNTQVALTLRLVGGLTTREIAAAFMVPEPTLAARIVRAKQKIRQAGIALTIPADLSERVDPLLGVLYLIFNEGYLSRGTAPAATRVDLVDEAIRLTEHARQLLPEDAEVAGLLALELFSRARFTTRIDAQGELVLLEDQDRSRWDLAATTRGNAVLAESLALMQPGPFQVQALIAAQHANARTAADTDWVVIAGLYDQLVAMSASPVIALNRAVAVAMADGAPAGLALLAALDGLDHYYLYHATRAELLVRNGDTEGAAASFTRAIELVTNRAERSHLIRRSATTVGV